MSEVIAKRYAQALFDVAKERSTVDAVEEQLQVIQQTVKESKDLNTMLNHPRIKGEDKKAVLEQIFKDEVNAEVLNLLKVLVDRGRESLLNDLSESYTAIANEARGIVDMYVTTAEPLSQEDEDKLSKSFGNVLNKQLRIHSKVDAGVIGGVLVRIGNRVYDGTLAGKLTRFHQEMKASR
ncbi:F0F1 ATP synthase subunit delta [Pullulanibacillus sp. KACC 23026]|uniref:F0F1 ATP synthase subunit delta n=1 Tax=Pullulanibacillus sp. KACC 23026 TaxID=3028315 RepID=UPI0023AF42F4|nr:F0F1 ATP synthase subunit delta [Pullulanibacillus sp. KACC 23026]WEG13111.1 F0F1 ATP synthase subunit delta [Pullulanibacillus sp. KACC 23026]